MATARIQPIEVLPGVRLCPLAAFSGITETAWFGVDTGDVNDLLAGGQSIGMGGGIVFGTFCRTSITLRLTGHMRILSGGQDGLRVYLNDGLLWEKVSDTSEGQAYWTHYFGGPTADPNEVYPYYEGTLGSEQLYHDLEITLETRGCGNVIKLEAGFDTTLPTTGSWEAKIIAIS